MDKRTLIDDLQKMSVCPVCGSKETGKYASFHGYDYHQCRKCCLVFLAGSIPYSNEVLYSYEYIKKRQYDNPRSYVAKAKAKTADLYFSLLESYAAKENILEIGCGTGIVLKVARDRGWNIYGTEVNEVAFSIAKDYLNTRNIKLGNLTEDMFPDSFFSAIVMFDVIEHISDPLSLMEVLSKKLKRCGFLLLISPNINSISARILKEKWPHFFLEHACLYSPKSIVYLLEKYHFKIIKNGWAPKFVSLEMLRSHLECNPDIFLSKVLLVLFKTVSYFEKIAFPFNIGEMSVLAQDKR